MNVMSRRYNLPPHEPEDHRQVLFGNLGEEYGSGEEQRQVELFLSVSVDECPDCVMRLLWPVAKRPSVVVSMWAIVQLLVRIDPVSEEQVGRARELVESASVAERGQRVLQWAAGYVDRMRALGGGDHGPDCEDCRARSAHWDAVERRGRA